MTVIGPAAEGRTEGVLRPGGRLAILEFGQPRIAGLLTLYAWYFRYLLPLIGRTISKHQSAYSYLPASVGTFPSPSEFLQMCESSGFSRAGAVPLTFGIVYLYTAERGSLEGYGSKVLRF